MASPAEIQAQLERGWQFHSDLMARDLTKAASGCGCCGDSLTMCLYNILKSLQDRVDLGVYDDTTDKLYTDMMEIIGPGTPVYGPQVDAGAPQVILQPSDSVSMNGTVTAGDNPIDQIMWVQLTGPNQSNIVDPTDPQTVVDGLIPGSYTFRLSAIDTIGKIGSDTTVVTVEAADVVAYYWNQSDNSMPSYADILMKPSVSFVSGNPITVPFVDDGQPMYSFMAYPMSEPQRTQWSDVMEFWNNGTVGEPGGLFAAYITVGGFRVTVTNYKTQFINPIRFQ